jgi:hypothetical protein
VRRRIASFGGELPVRHGGASRRIAGRIVRRRIASFGGELLVRHGGASRRIAGRIDT